MATSKVEAHSAVQLFKSISVRANHNYDNRKDSSDGGSSWIKVLIESFTDKTQMSPGVCKVLV